MLRLSRYARLVPLISVIVLAVVMVASSVQSEQDRGLKYALSDIRVLYLFDDPQDVDWPSLYYLNDRFGARIDLASVGQSSGFRYEIRSLPDREIYWHRFQVGEEQADAVDSILAVLFRVRRPDVVLINEASGGGQYPALVSRLRQLPADTAALFNIDAIYLRVDNDSAGQGDRSVITLNRRELAAQYKDRIDAELEKLWERFNFSRDALPRLARYVELRGIPQENRLTADFLAGMTTFRLARIIDASLPAGATQKTIKRQVEVLLSNLSRAGNLSGRQKAELMIEGYKKLLSVQYQIINLNDLIHRKRIVAYLERLSRRVQRAVLATIGLDWEGKITVHDSPHGPRLKFRASLSANGPHVIELSYIRFQPYWENTVRIVDSISRQIAPHQSFVQEYLIDVDRSYLEADMPESLLFEAEIIYGDIPLPVYSSIPIWERPDLSVRFEPNFYFMPPSARVDVDRLARHMNWKVVISKPMYYSGTVRINLETPRGVFAGAYRQTLSLGKGRFTETVRIPFSISNLFELGVHTSEVTLSVNGQIISSDSAILRIAKCQIASNVTVGFLPDSSGLLEDILRMTGVTFSPLTNRSLITGDLDAYKVIIIGSGALRDFPSFRNITGRLEDYLRFGGSLIVMGQPDDWPQGSLPVSFVPSLETISPNEVLNRIPEARTLTRPYVISQSGLLASFDSGRRVAAAIVSPAEKVFVTTTGATLLSVSRIGDGQIIFCGLPLTEMISDLNIDAIHLLANLLNY